MQKRFLFLLIILFKLLILSSRADCNTPTPEVVKYIIHIELNDKNDEIKGSTGVILNLRDNSDVVKLDFANRVSDGSGMTTDSIIIDSHKVNFIHEDNQLIIDLPPHSINHTLLLTVYYRGVPGDGLIISKNMYGDRTFFADNWPNRAHNWFPCNDHPSDKAVVDFIITAPTNYQIIAPGNKQMQINSGGQMMTHYWSSDIPISTKVMVFGAAPFAVQYLENINGIEYSNWVYPQNKEAGFSDFSITPDVINFFSDLIAPYPFEKIANVQSTTRYGGMENAGNIFYNEKAITGTGSISNTIVHEIAHQWFGNSLTEKDWAHLWLSEGFATWLTNYYNEKTRGEEYSIDQLIRQRNRVIDYSKQKLSPVVDNYPESITSLLNPNTYQKGAWILHMIRDKTGEDLLIESLVKFYESYKYGVAGSEDFRAILEKVTDTDFEQFFDDWVYSSGHPVISSTTRVNNNLLTLTLLQHQEHKIAFTFPLEIRLLFEDGNHIDQQFDIMFRRHEFIIEVPSEPVEIILDPNTKLLFEERIINRL